MHIHEAQFPADQVALVALIREYATWLNIDMSFQNFDQEMEQIDIEYSLPKGLLWTLQDGGKLVGCVGFKRLDEATAEVKRLYVQPAYRRQRWGYELMQMVLGTTRQLGYKRLVLDTVPQTIDAQSLYIHMGFKPIPPYYNSFTLATDFFELQL
jgi:putative acetyltransferase